MPERRQKAEIGLPLYYCITKEEMQHRSKSFFFFSLIEILHHSVFCYCAYDFVLS